MLAAYLQDYQVMHGTRVCVKGEALRYKNVFSQTQKLELPDVRVLLQIENIIS